MSAHSWRNCISENIYAIARIVVFKDNILANAKPEWAIIDTRTQKPWMDREELAWVDPFRKEVWNYNIAIAKEAAKAGFDEIQFDYMRFPTDGKLSSARYSQPNNMENRVKTINSFSGDSGQGTPALQRLFFRRHFRLHAVELQRHRHRPAN